MVGSLFSLGKSNVSVSFSTKVPTQTHTTLIGLIQSQTLCSVSFLEENKKS